MKTKIKKKKNINSFVSVLALLIGICIGLEYQNHIKEILSPFASFLSSLKNFFK
jgi:small basic protein